MTNPGVCKQVFKGDGAFDDAPKDSFYFWSPRKNVFLLVLSDGNARDSLVSFKQGLADPFSHPNMAMFTSEILPHEVRMGKYHHDVIEDFWAEMISLCVESDCHWTSRFSDDAETKRRTIHLFFEKAETAEAVRKAISAFGFEDLLTRLGQGI